ncbi:hypothetical protein E4U19_003809 [Claviceps sp. Clav32 group G5]|nr:hypothetical protein E4U40_004364 [Claviceps sp. LM458 group G5]KAG6036111.1 hypothetical protein E4U19_003809 [Claviceps sp. Clav32 group G5]
MSETPLKQKTTPARRDHGRRTARSAAHKAYASETDAIPSDANRLHDTPQTPNHMKVDLYPANETSSRKAPGSKGRSRNKPRHGPTSPDFAPVLGQTPPHRSVSIKAGMSTAYAGATFHASPAPSSLPIPSFLCKSPAESPLSAARGFTPQVPSPPTTDQGVSTPFRSSSLLKTSESPLDFMFRAHRQEKERGTRDKHPELYMPHQESPGSVPRCETNSGFKSTSLPHTRRGNIGSQPGRIDATELDGTPGRPVGPAFSTPYQDRIKAARPVTRPKHPNGHSQSGTSLHNSQVDQAEALKKFLFGSTGPLYSGSISAPSGFQPSPQNNPRSSHSTPRSNDFGRSGKIEAMEDDLRRILKLDVSSKTPPTDRIF